MINRCSKVRLSRTLLDNEVVVYAAQARMIWRDGALGTRFMETVKKMSLT